MRQDFAIMNVAKHQYELILSLGTTVHDQMLLNISLFGTPVISMSDLDDANGLLDGFISAWGPEGNRGSKKTHLDLVGQANINFGLLRNLCDYTNSLYRGNSSNLAKSGFPLSSQPTSVVAGAVRNLRQATNESIQSWEAEIKFDKPLDTQKSAKLNYELFRSETPSFANAEFITSDSKTTFIDAPLAAGDAPQVFYYWVQCRATNTVVLSPMLIVRLFPVA